ncbi:MAG: metallophosphoesterase [Pannonibacter sp.]
MLYVVGDVHGRLDLLQDLESQIDADARRLGLPPTVVYLGDLVDRGPASAQLLDRATGPGPAGWTRHFLAGNHELMMLGFLQNPKANLAWLDFGGIEALYSYGFQPSELEQIRRQPAKSLNLLRSYVPEDHVAFLETLATGLLYPGLLLVHAGIRPGVPLEEQSDLDLTRIKAEFLDSTADHGVLVVHGHSIVKTPEIRPNRIAIDTGAYATGVLTALRLTGTSPSAFLQTGAGRNE